MIYLGLIIADLDHRRGIDTTYIFPTRGVISDEKIPRLNYDCPVLVDRQEVHFKRICNYLTIRIQNMPVCHNYIIFHLNFGYDINLEFYNRTIEHFLFLWFFDPTLAWKVLKEVMVGLIIMQTHILFNGDIKLWSIVQCGSSWKLTDW